MPRQTSSTIGRRRRGPGAGLGGALVALGCLAGCAVVPPGSVMSQPVILTPTVDASTPGSTPGVSTPTWPSSTPTGALSGRADPLAGMVAAPEASERPSRGGAVLAPTASGPLTGRTILVDPGHNGRYDATIENALVPAGHGTTKPCNSTGTESIDGTAEYVLTWAIGVKLTGLLRAQGATVRMTRPSNDGVGPCVDERAAIANRNGVDLVLSIHGDGAERAGLRGFHVIVSTTMAGGAAVQTRSLAVARTLVDEFARRTGLPRSTYVGDGTGIFLRDDIAGLNLLTGEPGVMLEVGNLRDASDWAVLKSPAGQDAAAAALAATAVGVLS